MNGRFVHDRCQWTQGRVKLLGFRLSSNAHMRRWPSVALKSWWLRTFGCRSSLVGGGGSGGGFVGGTSR